jgi:hypothetical protein
MMTDKDKIENPAANELKNAAPTKDSYKQLMKRIIASRKAKRTHKKKSDIQLKHDIALLGRCDSGLGFYRFCYNGSDKVYVGVMAQDVQSTMPEAVVRGKDGYLYVYYERLGLKLQTWDEWVASGKKIPAGRCIETALNA